MTKLLASSNINDFNILAFKINASIIVNQGSKQFGHQSIANIKLVHNDTWCSECNKCSYFHGKQYQLDRSSVYFCVPQCCRLLTSHSLTSTEWCWLKFCTAQVMMIYMSISCMLRSSLLEPCRIWVNENRCLWPEHPFWAVLGWALPYPGGLCARCGLLPLSGTASVYVNQAYLYISQRKHN